MFWKGSTAIEGLSGSAKLGGVRDAGFELAVSRSHIKP